MAPTSRNAIETSIHDVISGISGTYYFRQANSTIEEECGSYQQMLVS